MEKGLPLLAKVLEDKRLKGKVHLALIGDGPIRKQLESRTFARVRYVERKERGEDGEVERVERVKGVKRVKG